MLLMLLSGAMCSSLPVSNSSVERIFSTLKLLKTQRRSSLSIETMDNLLTLNIGKGSLESFNSTRAVDLWWHVKKRRPNQSARRPHQQWRGSSVREQIVEEEHVSLADWDERMTEEG